MTDVSSSEEEGLASPIKNSNKRKSRGSEDDDDASDASSSTKQKTTDERKDARKSHIFPRLEYVKGIPYKAVRGGCVVIKSVADKVKRRSSSPKSGTASASRFIKG